MVDVARNRSNFSMKFRGGLDFWSREGKIFELAGTNLTNSAKFKSCKKVYETGKLANLVNFFSMIRWDFEDLFHLATMTLKSDAELRRGRSQAGAWERD